MSLAITSSGFCSSPCTLTVPAEPRAPVERAARDRAGDVLAGGLDVVDERDQLGAALEPALLLDDELRQRRAAVAASSLLPWKTRLARMSAAAIVCSASRVDRRSPRANRRFAWRRRARSSALRIERALAKCGCARRSAMYSRERRLGVRRRAGSRASPASARRSRRARPRCSRGSRCGGRCATPSRDCCGRTCPSGPCSRRGSRRGRRAGSPSPAAGSRSPPARSRARSRGGRGSTPRR